MMAPRTKGVRRFRRDASHVTRKDETIPEAQTGMAMSCATVLVQPSSVKMVGEKADIEAAVMSQQKKQRVNK